MLVQQMQQYGSSRGCWRGGVPALLQETGPGEFVSRPSGTVPAAEAPGEPESPSPFPIALRLQVPRTRAARCLVVKRFSLLFIPNVLLKV